MSETVAARKSWLGDVLEHPLRWLLIWALLLVLLRLWSSPALELDEAEQMLWSQQLLWGYGAQPPLYTWLQWGVSALLGPGLLALSVLKMGLLASTYAFIWRVAREALPPRMAWWAAASMVWLPVMGWESLRDLTHTVLVCCMVAATWWLVLRQLTQPSRMGYAWLGLVLALGFLSKYSFALFAVALGLALLSGRDTRAMLFGRGWWWLPLTAAGLLLPHLLWLLEHWQLASRGTLKKLHLQPDASLWHGLSSLLVNGLLANLLLWMLLALLVFGRAWWRSVAVSPARSEQALPWLKPLLWRYLACVACLLLGMVIVGDVTQFKERWVHPFLIIVPLLAFLVRPSLELHPRGPWFTRTVLIGFLLFGSIFAARPWLNTKMYRLDEINEPIASLAHQLQRAGYDGRSPIVASDGVLGGMLRSRFPQAPVTVCRPSALTDAPACMLAARQAPWAAQPGSQSVLLVARHVEPDADWWRAIGTSISVQDVHTLQLPYLHAPATQLRYQYLWQQNLDRVD
jgi:4-amino-4-deoxy-L-arabinose transferase-like glycosyltransferase